MRKIYIYGVIACLVFSSLLELSAQNIDLENIGSRVQETLKKNPFRVSGGISANTVFYNSNMENSRAPFTYFLNGNLNLSLYQWTLPISYSLTNQGSTLGYQIPFKFNRLSIHPKYKWIRAHIGDASMSFSSYTYNGLLFTGVGVELTPDIPLKFSAFGGRFNKAIEDDGTPATVPAFKRNGYGVNIGWEKDRYKIGLIGFYAKDDLSSLDSVPENKKILPQENVALSLKASIFVLKNIEIFGEYARTGITNDLRISTQWQSKDLTAVLLKENSSTEFHNAYNTGINIGFNIGFVGLRYERIDPGYRTLGAYYFNNDFENITLNSSLNLFKGNLALSANVGKQRDNLAMQKMKETSRWVGSLNANLKVSEKITLTGSYSNFTMFTNNQLNQFVDINQNPHQLQQPRDSINYKQISQNATVNINYIISNTENLNQNLNASYSLNDMVNSENNIIRKGGITRFHNGNTTYSMSLSKIKLNISASFNYTHTYAASQTMSIWGPSLSVSKGFFKDNNMQLSFGASYNQSNSLQSVVRVANLRFSANYMPWKNHNITAAIIQMFRNSNQTNQSVLNEFTTTLGYAYSF